MHQNRSLVLRSLAASQQGRGCLDMQVHPGTRAPGHPGTRGPGVPGSCILVAHFSIKRYPGRSQAPHRPLDTHRRESEKEKRLPDLVPDGPVPPTTPPAAPGAALLTSRICPPGDCIAAASIRVLRCGSAVCPPGRAAKLPRCAVQLRRGLDLHRRRSSQ